MSKISPIVLLTASGMSGRLLIIINILWVHGHDGLVVKTDGYSAEGPKINISIEHCKYVSHVSDTSPLIPIMGSVHRFNCTLATLEGCSINRGIQYVKLIIEQFALISKI